MKPHHKIFLTSLALLLIVLHANCQTKMKDGRIEYASHFRDTANISVFDSMFMSKFTFLVKGNMSRTEIIGGMMGSMIQLFDSKTHDKIVFVMNDEKKEAVKIHNADKDIKGQKSPGNKFQYLDESKIICGYKCKRAEFTNGIDTTKMYVYYTNDFAADLSPNLKYVYYDLKGYPMEFNQFISGKELVTTITNISFEKTDENLYKLPDEYKMVTLPFMKK